MASVLASHGGTLIIHAMQRPDRLIFLLLNLAVTVGAQTPLPPEALLTAQEIQQLQQKQQYTEAMQKLDELEEKYPDRAELINMRGAMYMTNALRDLDKAEENFDRAAKLAPNDFAIRFNKAEVRFVKHEWAEAATAFQKLLDDFPKLPMTYRHIVLFKRLVCEAKLEQLTSAEKTLTDHFTFMDDTPAYYYSKAAIAFQKKDEAAAKDWLARANGIFKPQESSAYLDTLIEARWVPHLGIPEAPKQE
jgi:tetratricopeptide (TPR) repeat protein